MSSSSLMLPSIFHHQHLSDAPKGPLCGLTVNPLIRCHPVMCWEGREIRGGGEVGIWSHDFLVSCFHCPPIAYWVMAHVCLSISPVPTSLLPSDLPAVVYSGWWRMRSSQLTGLRHQCWVLFPLHLSLPCLSTYCGPADAVTASCKGSSFLCDWKTQHNELIFETQLKTFFLNKFFLLSL